MNLVILCIKIFIARIMDVSLGTVRTVQTVRGKNLLAALVGFFEVTIWFLVVKDALSSDYDSIFIVLSYAAGYATGTYIGGVISGLINTKLCIQIVVDKESINLAQKLRNKGFAVTIMDVKGYETDDKYMLLMEIDSKVLKEVEKIIHKYDKKVFMMVHETKYVRNGYFNGMVK